MLLMGISVEGRPGIFSGAKKSRIDGVFDEKMAGRNSCPSDTAAE